MKLLKNMRGDTIVEVMLSVAVVSSVLGAAYAATARNLKLGREAQERTEAVEIVKGQVDQLRYKSAVKELGPVSPTNRFCIDSTGSVAKFTGVDIGVEPTLAADMADNFSRYRAECRVGSAPFNLFIVQDSSDPRLFRAYARWVSVKGTADQVGITYRVYEK